MRAVRRAARTAPPAFAVPLRTVPPRRYRTGSGSPVSVDSSRTASGETTVAVDRDDLAAPHRDDVADGDRVDRDLLDRPGPVQVRDLRRPLQEHPELPPRPPRGARLEGVAAAEHQRDDRARRGTGRARARRPWRPARWRRRRSARVRACADIDEQDEQQRRDRRGPHRARDIAARRRARPPRRRRWRPRRPPGRWTPGRRRRRGRTIPAVAVGLGSIALRDCAPARSRSSADPRIGSVATTDRVRVAQRGSWRLTRLGAWRRHQTPCEETP